MARDIGITYWPIGDSITFGYDVSAPTVPLAGRYADLVKANLAASRQVFYKNEGRSGWTTTQMIPIVQSFARNLDADVVTILIGTNDAGGSVDQTTYSNNLVSIIQAIKGGKRLGLCDIYLCKLTPRFDGVDLTAYNQTIQSVASAQGATVIDLSAVLPDATYTQDNLHPTVQGYQLMSDAIWQVLQSRQSVWGKVQQRPKVL